MLGKWERDMIVKKKVLRVQMLGGFEVTYADMPIITKDARNSMLTQLMQYLIVNRNKMVSQDELISVLLGEDEMGNPAVTLKNIVYRLRKLLVAGGIEKECIIYKKGAYGFCSDLPCDIDIEKFAALANEIRSKKMSEAERLELCFEAMDLYKGEFLLKVSGEPWVMKNSLYYQDMYLAVVEKAYEIASEMGEYERILPQLKKAAQIYPYEEEVYLMHISCLHELGKIKEAVAEYELVTAILFDDLGIGPSERLRELYTQITDGVQQVSDSIVDIRNKMNEMATEKGSFFCNLETFANIYQFAVRHMDRSGKSVFLMLCSLSEMDDSPLKTGTRMKKVIAATREAVRLTCRKGDVYTRYSPTQFLLMLMEIKQENCDVVAGRLRRNFYKQPKMSRVQMHCRSISAADMDLIMEDMDAELEPSWEAGNNPE